MLWLIGLSLRRRHAGSRIASARSLVSPVFNKTHHLRGRDIWLDEVKQIAVEPRQDRTCMVRNQPSSASTADQWPLLANRLGDDDDDKVANDAVTVCLVPPDIMNVSSCCNRCSSLLPSFYGTLHFSL